ncbi:MAG: hypothetical protein PHO89_04825 [Methylacidiphilaceae bacterium]|nr:hypothetical protein [Candidatus Methylacidiphilaceae bacterium]
MTIPSAISPVAGHPVSLITPNPVPPAPPAPLPSLVVGGSPAVSSPPLGNLSALEATDGRILVSSSDSISSPGDLILSGLERLAGRLQGSLQLAGGQLSGMEAGGGLRDLIDLQANVGIAAVEMQLSAGVAETTSQGTRTLLQA